jgi:predicted MFS family arabinose efflux permease
MLSLGSSAANFAGPLVAGLSIDYLGHRAAFGVLAALTIVPLVVLASGRLRLPEFKRPPDRGEPRGLLDLLAYPKLRRLFIVNAFVSVGWDVHTVFVPIYGTRIGLSGSEIGIVVSSFAAATFAVRFAIRWVVRHASEQTILATALLVAAVVYLLLSLTQSVLLLAMLSFVLGLGLGTGQPIVMSLLHHACPGGRLGEAAGVRISLIQSMAVAVPLVFGAVGSSLGLLAVFWGAGLCVGAAGSRCGGTGMTGLARAPGARVYRNRWTDQSRQSWTSSGDCVEMRTGHSASKRDFLDCSIGHDNTAP